MFLPNPLTGDAGVMPKKHDI